jgi:L-histidine N-alpha-methyltransferase
MTTPRLQVDVHLGPDDIAAALREDVRAGLTSDPKTLPPKWFYDDRGSDLFDEITRLPEYYPTRREAEILQREAKAIAVVSGADTLIELGSGTSEKTLLLLDAFAARGHLRRFVPFDVSEATLRDAAERIDARYPGIAVHAVVGDFDHHLALLPGGGQRLVAFLGGTIGNLEPAGRRRFVSTVHDLLEPGEHLLVGTDLVKDPGRLVAAYDDAAGVTAEFNKNVLLVLGRELGADLDPDDFGHVARWNAEEERIEMWLRAETDVAVTIEALDLRVTFAAGEEMCTELSCKFTPERIEAELDGAGFDIAELWTDEAGDFALTLARRR